MKQLSLVFLIIVVFSGVACPQSRPPVELIVESGHSEAIRSIAVSADGRLMASGSNDGMIRLWEVDSGIELKTLRGHIKPVNSIAFSPDRKLLASSSVNDAKLWEVESGKELKTIAGDGLGSILFSPDGKTFAYADSRTVKIWNVESGAQQKTLFVNYYAFVNSVRFSPDGKLLATGSDDGTIKIWDLETGKESKLVIKHGTSVRSLGFSPNGGSLVSGGNDPSVKIWDVQTGLETGSFRHIEHEVPLMFGTPSVQTVVFSPDGQSLASASIGDFTVKMWDVRNGKKLTTLNADTVAVFSPDGRSLVTGGSSHDIKVWDVQTGNALKTLADRSARVVCIALSSDGRFLVSGGLRYINVWNLRSGQQLKTLDSLSSEVGTLAFSSDGTTLASSADHYAIKLWDVESGVVLKTLYGHTDAIHSIRFSSDGRSLVSASWDKTIKLWDVESGKELQTLKGHTAQVYTAALSPDGQMVASGGFDQTIKLWDTKTGKLLKNLNNVDAITATNLLPPSVDSVVFSPDGKTIATESGNGIVKLWDVSSGTILRSFDESDAAAIGQITSVVPNFFSITRQAPVTTDGKTQFKIGANNQIDLVDAKTGKLMASLLALERSDWVVTRPDGRFDTNKSLDRIEGLHWIFNDEILKPQPLEIFMRQYFEPNLLQRLIECNENNRCDTEFRELPPIGQLDRLQPVVAKPVVSTPD